MKTKTILFALSLLAATTAFAQDEKKQLSNIGNENTNQGDFKFNEEEFNFGSIKQGDVVTHEFDFTNNGNEPIIISSAAGSCGCTVPTWPKEPITKGQKSTIKVTFNSAGKMGMQDKTVTINSNAKQNPMVIHMKGTVEKPAEQPAEPNKK
ncbi:MAG: DUF1573 domain-containing protein [Bacteroidetes bacterium]|nr:DUF1573 domain-containing protein [Bacteroidota bacterium]